MAEEVAKTAFWLALISSGASAVFYLSYAFGSRVVIRRLATVPASAAGSVASLERLPESFGRLGTLLGWTTVAFLLISLLARWQSTGYAPFANMWEFTVAFAGGVVLFSVAFERWYGQRTLGIFLMPLAVGMMAVAAAFFPSRVEPLVPALQSRGILAAHVGMMVLAYSALSVSFAAAAGYIVQGGKRRFSRLPSRAVLDEIAHKSVIFGFPILALGIALGAYWGNSAWGRYWGWDPKETSALVTWLIYGIYLHMRAIRNWAGVRSAYLLVGAYFAVLFTYFAVNLWVSGLHSYSGV